MPLLRGGPSLDEIRVKVFTWQALKYELEPAQDYARPGNSPPEHAFQVLKTGFDLALEIARSGVPSEDRKTQKRAAKWMVEDAPFRDGPIGVNVLAVALPTIMVRTGGDLLGAITDRVPSLARQEDLLSAVADFFPLDQVGRKVLAPCLAEYDVMETKRARPKVASGAEPAAPYSAALMRGEDPDQDPALVEDQQRWARDYFIGEATWGACYFILGNDFKKLQGEMRKISWLGPGATEFRERLLGAWARGSQAFRDYGLLGETG